MNNDNTFNWVTDSFLDRDYNWTSTIAETRIITIPNNKNSIEQSERALNSCTRIDQPNAEIFWGYDGTDHRTIHTPEHLKNNDVMRWIKVLDPALSVTEVACALSHIALWVRCITINRPIVILEHDSIMIRPFLTMSQTNCIEYLGHHREMGYLISSQGYDTYPELVESYLDPRNYPPPTKRHPMISVINYNYLYSMGLHAYAIDPFIARRLFARVLTDGLINAVDTLVEVSDFELIQNEVYAFNSSQSKFSTIDKKDGTIMQGRKNTFSVPGVSQ